jgi:transcriptional regulator with XRE-family HTH domain
MNKLTGKDIRSIIGKNIKLLRSRKNLSQLALANRADLTHNFINELENGHKWLSPETLAKLSSALDAEPYHFFLAENLQNNLQSEIFSGYLQDLTDVFNTKVREIQGYYSPDAEER